MRRVPRVPHRPQGETQWRAVVTVIALVSSCVPVSCGRFNVGLGVGHGARDSQHTDTETLSSVSDRELFSFLPVQKDFPDNTFVMESPLLSTAVSRGPSIGATQDSDPKECVPDDPKVWRAHQVSGSWENESGEHVVTFTLGKQTRTQGAAQHVRDWINHCSHFHTTFSHGGVEGEKTISVLSLAAPDVTLEERVAYEQHIEGSVHMVGSSEVTKLDSREKILWGSLRGLFVSALWYNDADEELAVRLLAHMADTIRVR